MKKSKIIFYLMVCVWIIDLLMSKEDHLIYFTLELPLNECSITMTIMFIVGQIIKERENSGTKKNNDLQEDD